MRVTEESHADWSFKSDMVGGYYIVDANGWELAHLKYDYAHTCNATNHHRARLLAAAPEMLKALERVLQTSELPRETLLAVEQAVAKATGQPIPE